MDRNLEDLKLKPSVLRELHQCGYKTVSDLAVVDKVEILRMPGVGGYEWRKIAAALEDYRSGVWTPRES